MSPGEKFDIALTTWLAVMVSWGSTAVFGMPMWTLAFGFGLMAVYRFVRLVAE